jgi:hypothetical protein
LEYVRKKKKRERERERDRERENSLSAPFRCRCEASVWNTLNSYHPQLRIWDTVSAVSKCSLPLQQEEFAQFFVLLGACS